MVLYYFCPFCRGRKVNGIHLVSQVQNGRGDIRVKMYLTLKPLSYIMALLSWKNDLYEKSFIGEGAMGYSFEKGIRVNVAKFLCLMQTLKTVLRVNMSF